MSTPILAMVWVCSLKKEFEATPIGIKIKYEKSVRAAIKLSKTDQILVECI